MILEEGMLVVVTHEKHPEFMIQGRLKVSKYSGHSFVIEGSNYALYPGLSSYKSLDVKVIE